MSYYELKTTITTLQLTAIEKVNVLGSEDAKEYIKPMVTIARDLLDFWADVTTIDEDAELQRIIDDMENLL